MTAVWSITASSARGQPWCFGFPCPRRSAARLRGTPRAASMGPCHMLYPSRFSGTTAVTAGRNWPLSMMARVPSHTVSPAADSTIVIPFRRPAVSWPCPTAICCLPSAVEPCKGGLTLPGGFIELGETPEEAALRELREETNLHADRATLLGVSTRQSPASGAIMVLGYMVEEWSGLESMRPDTDAQALEFFPVNRRPALAFSVHRELLSLYDRHGARHP